MSRTGIQTLMDTKPRKKKEDADEQARLQEELRSFESEFGQTEALKTKAFIRMDIVNANKSVGETKPTIYKPELPNPLMEISKRATPSSSNSKNFEEAKRIAAEKARKMMEDAHKGKPGPPPSVVVPTTAPPLNRPPKPGTQRAKEIQKSKTTNLDAFKEELKRMQAERDTRKNVRAHLKNELGVDQAQIDLMAPMIENPYAGSGSAELDDNSTTTNIYIGNLPLTVTMNELLDTFGTYGPLASGKILYPRPDEERKREYLCGFIAYMSRKDFDRAFTQLPGLMIRGETIKISYARAVTIPAVPFYVPPSLERLSFPDAPTGLPFNAVPRSSDLRAYLEKWKDLPKLGGGLPEDPDQLDDYKKMIKNATVRVVIPTDSQLLGVVHRTIEFVVREGPLFEAILMSREQKNPLFRFLFDNHHPAHVYYRWRLFSVLQGEQPYNWRRERFRLFDEGSWWTPPIPPHELFKCMPESLYHAAFSVAEQRLKMGVIGAEKVSSERRKDMDNERRSPSPQTKEKRKKKKTYLSSRDRVKLEDTLRELIPEKDMVGIAMVWCVEHATWAKEIAECLYESLTIDETPLHKKVARLYLIADILANAAVRGVKDVFYFRQYFETLFPKIFAALGRTLRSIEGRIKAEQFKQRVMNCFRAWEDNTLYSNETLIHCQNIFLGLIEQKSDDEQMDMDEDVDGAPIDDELDGVPIESMSNHSSIPSAGASKWATLTTDDEMDGTPLEDIKPSPVKPAFKPMQWSNVADGPSAKKSKWEEAEGEEEDEDNPSRRVKARISPSLDKEDPRLAPIFPDPESESDEEKNGFATKAPQSASVAAGGIAVDDERRRLMREIEVKVMSLQDELEADGEGDVRKKVDKYRGELMKKMEDKIGKEKKKKEKKDKDKKKEKKEEKKERSRSKDREKKRSRSKSRERRKERSRSRERDRTERERDRDRRDRDRESRRESRRSRSRSREKDRERERERDRRSRSRDRRR